MERLVTRPLETPLRARIRVPGDKSISHRALLLGALARGHTPIRGLLDAADVRATLAALRALGVAAEPDGVTGRRWRNGGTIDCGNSGTTARLLLGALAGRAGAVLVGDTSLSSRPMGRLVRLLRVLGAEIRGGDHLPLTVSRAHLTGAGFRPAIASAQVKSAVLLAGLHADGITRYTEGVPSRDHTERLLRAMGAPLDFSPRRGGVGGTWSIARGTLQAVPVDVPGDFSSAAFWLVAAAILPGSDVVVEHVGLNPTRTGLLDVLRAMGARVDVEDRGGIEPVGTIRVRAAGLRGVEIGGVMIPRIIDELPVLAVAAAFAEGETVVRDAGELRLKESDRIASMVEGLRAMEVDAEALPDGYRIRGGVGCGAVIQSRGDHRIAMSFAIAGLATGMMVNDTECVGTSYPDFPRQLAEVGAG